LQLCTENSATAQRAAVILSSDGDGTGVRRGTAIEILIARPGAFKILISPRAPHDGPPSEFPASMSYRPPFIRFRIRIR
jgi:hypothetical protein